MSLTSSRIASLASLASLSIVAAASFVACSGDDSAASSADAGLRAPDASLTSDGATAPGPDGAAAHDGASDAGAPLDAQTGDAGKTLVLSFAVVGCNRIDPADYAAADASAQLPPSTANVAQLTRTFDEIAKMTPKPKYFFAAGDIIMGYVNDQGDAGVTTLDGQLSAWLALYEASSLKAAGVTLVPIPGNHEVQSKIGGVKTAFAGAEAIWLKHMGSFLPAGFHAGPAAGTRVLAGDAGADASTLATDQTKLTYSFDDGSTHFVVVDTDPVGADWNVPADWVANDLAAAKAAGAKHVFSIGHKPAFSFPLVPLDGLSTGVTRDAFWSALESAHSEAMIAAHNHVFWWTQPNPGKTLQVVAGNGGSRLESSVLTPPAGGLPANTGKYYGFTVVSVWSDDTVTIDSYGRDLPSGNYFDPAPAASYPTTLRTSIPATWGTTHP